jgi:hypothetical protein
MRKKSGCLAAVAIVIIGLIILVAVILAAGHHFGQGVNVGHTPPPGGMGYMQVSFHA